VGWSAVAEVSTPRGEGEGRMKRRLPVVIAGTNCLSGVTSWADQLRTALADHTRYDVRTLHVGPQVDDHADIAVRTLPEAHETVCRMAPAIVIPNYVWSLFLTAFEPGIQCLGMCHADNVAQYYRPLSWYEPAIAKFIAVSNECHGHLKEYVSFRAHDIITLPYGVCVPDQLKRTYQTKPLRLIYAGRVTQPQKRVWDFVPLVEHLLRAKVPFVLDIVGEGDEFAPLQQVMRARIPAADVHFHPRVPHREMAAKWLSHDIFLQVSDFEGTSVSMLEAMAHGVVPVVTAASSGIAGVISPPDNGFVVPVGDMEAMARAISRLANDPTLLATAGRAAHHTAQAYSMELYARKFVRILDEVAEGDPAVDYHKRYGIFSPTHPLLVLRQIIEQQKTELGRRNERTLEKILRSRWGGLRSKAKSGPTDKRAA
jgi:glycosyltransferase involved in cell wall biosynthesis